jgi:hypothetical protein
MNKRIKKLNKSRSGEILGQYKPLQKFIDQIVFRKLKLAIRGFCSGMNDELLQVLSPRLHRLVYKTEKSVEIKFKLDGKTWPPQIVYKANVGMIKVIGFNREIEMGNEWRYIFTDKVMRKGVKERY